MCSPQLKEQIYSEFDNGLEPQQVIVKLNIPEEKRVVWGCYTYYKRSKINEEHTQKEKVLNDELKEAQHVNDEFMNAILLLEESINNFKNTIQRSKAKKYKYIMYEEARQVLLHKLENDQEDENTISDLKMIMTLRRLYKNSISAIGKIDITRFDNIKSQLGNMKKNIFS